MKVKNVKKFLEKLNADDEVYVGYNDFNELSFSLWTEEEIIDRANEKLGVGKNANVEPITDINDALCYLADEDYTYHFMD